MIHLLLAPLLLLPSGASADPVIHISQPLEFMEKTVRGEISPSEVQGLKSLRVKLDENSPEEELVMRSGERTRKVESCLQYRAALREGYRADTTYAQTMESFFKETCRLLHYLETAKIPSTSGKDLSLKSLDQIASTLLEFGDLSDSSVKAKKAPPASTSLAQTIKKEGFKLTRSSPMELRMENSTDLYAFTELARADFLGEGTEQVLVSAAYHAVGGTFRTYSTYVISPPRAAGQLASAREMK